MIMCGAGDSAADSNLVDLYGEKLLAPLSANGPLPCLPGDWQADAGQPLAAWVMQRGTPASSMCPAARAAQCGPGYQSLPPTL